MSRVKIIMDPTQKILLKRYLNRGGGAQLKFTKECAKQMNNYVPYNTGRLKDMMIIINPTNVTYNAPYAKKQYYMNAGNGKQGTSQGGVRGKQWAPRMWSAKGDGIVTTMASFVGGHR
ncbi:minor capsid protein [Clostridium estertheticum]|uniref:minor capsid protein n=1 Tax=Clostridium estertheticum TaxID=238834 RepID=UPI001CF2A1C6|nr:minor capsid protein [Clostridium estertheticum]MCB2308826.1 minor capsid protein [Clostridium estertheticum]MCB2347314.1 minor capsid protein [Clostridium estertheticum]MCB2351920.1 minor capsid protein [Clostridium estertheticum]WAG48513.1 minor capsid protein [Clostridium estertheticum]